MASVFSNPLRNPELLILRVLRLAQPLFYLELRAVDCGKGDLSSAKVWRLEGTRQGPGVPKQVAVPGVGKYEKSVAVCNLGRCKAGFPGKGRDVGVRISDFPPIQGDHRFLQSVVVLNRWHR
jgi:hypothetical protein